MDKIKLYLDKIELRAGVIGGVSIFAINRLLFDILLYVFADQGIITGLSRVFDDYIALFAIIGGCVITVIFSRKKPWLDCAIAMALSGLLLTVEDMIFSLSSLGDPIGKVLIEGVRELIVVLPMFALEGVIIGYILDKIATKIRAKKEADIS